MRFTPDTIYRLSKEDSDIYSEEALEDYGDSRRYEFARSESYANGSVVADVWIQDEDGNIHPGYCNSPIPMTITELTTIAG